jgi:SprT protein
MIEQVNVVLRKAEELFDVNLSDVELKVNIKGTCAGEAIKWPDDRLTLRLNIEACKKFPEYITANTIPHEVAHLVCMLRPTLGKGHDAGWKSVCVELGGDPSRTHTLELTPARKTRRFLYQNEGHTVELSIIRHNKLQKGKVTGYKTKEASFQAEHFKEEL